MGLEDTLKIAGLFGTAMAFGTGVYQYWKAQRWRRAEFVAGEVKAMKSDPAAQAAMLMLDWDGREVELHPDRPGRERRWVAVTQAQLVEALRRHSDGQPFTPDEARIRDVFDAFLDYLERFNQFVEARLVPAFAFEPYLRYWCRLLSDNQRPASRALWTYIDSYGFEGARQLVANLNSLHPSASRIQRRTE